MFSQTLLYRISTARISTQLLFCRTCHCFKISHRAGSKLRGISYGCFSDKRDMSFSRISHTKSINLCLIYCDSLKDVFGHIFQGTQNIIQRPTTNDKIDWFTPKWRVDVRALYSWVFYQLFPPVTNRVPPDGSRTRLRLDVVGEGHRWR